MASSTLVAHVQCPYTGTLRTLSHASVLFIGVLKTLIGKCVVGESVINICTTGDKELNEETGKVFKKEKDLKKGVAFPTCVSVNNCVCHYSPLKSDKDYALQDGDVVKL